MLRRKCLKKGPLIEIDIGRRSPAFPVTPPYMRVRIRRFRDLSPRGLEVRFAFRRGGLRRFQVPFGLHPIHPWKAPPKRIGWRMANPERRVLLLTITVRAFIPQSGTNMPSADFCWAIKVPHDAFSRDSATRSRSPEVSSTAFGTQPPDLQPVPLMDRGFVVNCRLARHRMPRIWFLYIGSYLCSTLLSDPASRRRPCASL